MKSKELIRRLQDVDPSGEVECCVGNEDIYFLDYMPAYYDGRLQFLIHDPEKIDKSWSITGAEIRSRGYKIEIKSMGIYDILWDDIDLKVTYDSESSRNQYEKVVASWREDIRKEHQELNEWSRYTGNLPERACRFCAEQATWGLRSKPAEKQTFYSKWHRIKCIFRELRKVITSG